eukprot:1737067-Heterocapsa_arctica.AAC.1
MARPPHMGTSSPTTTLRLAVTGASAIGSLPTGVTFTYARSLRAARPGSPRYTATATPPLQPWPSS